jgi:hypothetical protein
MATRSGPREVEAEEVVDRIYINGCPTSPVVEHLYQECTASALFGEKGHVCLYYTIPYHTLALGVRS